MKLYSSKILKSIPVICLIVAGCSEKKQEEVELVKPVKMMTVGNATDNLRITYPAKVSANKSSALSFDVDGVIMSKPISLGDKVKKGDVLAKLDPRDYLSNLKIAKAQLNEAESDYKRYATLVKSGAVARADYEARVKNYEVAKSNYRIAEKAYEDTILRAPFDGVVANTYVDEKQSVQAKETVLTLQNYDKIDISVQIPEQDIARVRRGLPRSEAEKLLDPRVTFPAAAPGKMYKVKIKEFSEEADPVTQTFKIVFTMPNPHDLVIRPEMTAQISLMQRYFKGMGGKGIQIPFTAVFLNDKGEKCVWVVKKDMTVTAVQVKTGDLNEGNVLITSGLKGGETIVISGADTLSEGMKVRKIEKIGI